jgi:phage FluMu gp28-like protein
MTPQAEKLSILLPYQSRWIADPAQVKVCEKSRRVGITWTEAADAALAAASQRGSDTWYIGYNKDMALEFVWTAAEWAKRFNRAARELEEIAINDENRDILAYRVRFASGHKITALSSRPSNLRGKDGRAVIDEAAFHDDLAGLMKAALAFTMWGGKVRVISTHNGADSAFNELVSDIRAGRLNYSLHRIAFDEAIAQGLFRKICERNEREWSEAAERAWRDEIVDFYGDNSDEELFCTPRANSSAYLSTPLIESRMRSASPVVRWAMPPEFASEPDEVRSKIALDFCREQLDPAIALLDPALMSCFGEDFGRSGDLTVIWPLQIEARLTRRTPFAVELRNIPFRQQEQILFYIADRLPRFFAGAMDARGNGQYLAEIAMQRYGNRIKQVMLSAEWYREQMPRYKAAFEDGTIELPKDDGILSDHRSLVMERGVVKVMERRERDATGARHGDSAIAGALAYFASYQDAVEYDYAPISRFAAPAIAGGMVNRAGTSEDALADRSRRFGAGAW